MAITCRVKVLLAERNLERSKAGLRAISVRQIAQQTGINLSALSRLIGNKTKRVDFETLDKLMEFFETGDLRDVLEYTSG